jgi:hypothetical protein
MTPHYHLHAKCIVLTGWCLAIIVAGLAAQEVIGAPANDSFTSPQTISGAFGSIQGSNVGATQGAGEYGVFPGISCSNTIWYKWVAPASGRYSFDTTGSGFDTFIAVFTATKTTDLPNTIVASNDDVWLGTSTSLAAFNAVANTPYRIMIDGKGTTGNLVLSWLPTPANDYYTNAQTVTGESGVITGVNIGATVEANERVLYAVNTEDGTLNLDTTNTDKLASTDASVWYRWTAPRSGMVAVDTAESNFDTVLAIYTGDTLATATFVGGNNNDAPDGTSVVWFPANAGVTYYISVNARTPAGVTDRFKLHWAYVPETAPDNDSFDHGLVIRGVAGEATGMNYNATHEAGEPAHSEYGVGKSVWYTWTAVSNGIVVFDTGCSSFNTRLAMYTGDSVNSLTWVTNNEISGLGPITVPVSGGAVYHIAVDGYLNQVETYGPWVAPTGRVALHWMMVPAVPVNDDFADATLITNSTGTVWGSNTGATNEIGEPIHSVTGGGLSVWYRWVAPYSGRFTFDTAGSGFDTVLAIYTGTAVNNLTTVVYDDDQQLPLSTSAASFNAVANTTYYIAVDGYLPEDSQDVKFGRFTLNWSPRYEGAVPPGPVLPPTLAIQPDPSASREIISWSANSPGFTLQMATSLTPAINWFDLTNLVSNSGFIYYTNNISESQSRFFRLRK